MQSVLQIPTLYDIPVLVRASTNVPLVGGVVANAFRLKRMLQTVEYLTSKGAKVIIMGHIGRSDTETLLPVFTELKRLLPKVYFSPEAIGPSARRAVRELHPGEVLLLENLRRYSGEEGNDAAFAAELASLADVFVEDSFDAAHRAHASIVGVSKLLPSYAGFLFEEELRELSQALRPVAPSLAVVSGVKFETKAPVLKKLLATYTHVFVGGAIGNDLLQASGVSVGASLVSGADTQFLTPVLSSSSLVLPRDAVVVNTAKESRITAVHDIRVDESIVDIGPETIAHLNSLGMKAKTILWNGPLGICEQGYADGTTAFARIVAASKAYSVVGGGDTVAALEKSNLTNSFSFVSTAGGAMLEFLAEGTLPGIRALG